MNSNDLFDIIGETPERYVLDAANVNAKVIPMRKRSPKRIWLIAAIIALILCLVGCAVIYVLSLEDMAFGNSVQEYYDGSTEEVTLLSLQGIKGTPGYQATKEWYAWLTELGLELVIDDMEFDMVVGAVGKQGVDIAMSGITITAERMNVINFSTPYYTESIVCVCKAEDTSLDSVGTVVDLLNVICAAN